MRTPSVQTRVRGPGLQDFVHYLEDTGIMESLETADEHVTRVCTPGSLTHVALSGRLRGYFEEYV